MEIFGSFLPGGKVKYGDPWLDEIRRQRQQAAAGYVAGPMGTTGLLGLARWIEGKVGRERDKSTLQKQGFEPVTTSVQDGTFAGQTAYRLSNRPPTPEDVAHNEKYGMRVAGNFPAWMGGQAYGQGVQTGRQETMEQRDDTPIIAKERRKLWKLYQRLKRPADLAAFKRHVRVFG